MAKPDPAKPAAALRPTLTPPRAHAAMPLVTPPDSPPSAPAATTVLAAGHAAAPAPALLVPVLLTLASGLTYTVGYAVAKAVQLESGISPWQVAFLRYALLLGAAVVALPFLRRPAEGVRLLLAPPAARAQRLAGFWLGASSLCALAAYRLLPLAEGTVLGFTMPLFLVTLAPLMLKERVPGSRWVAVAVGFAGVVLMARPGFSGNSGETIGALLQVGTALSYALYQIVARQARAVATPVSLTVQAALVGVVLLAPAMPFVWTAPSAGAWLAAAAFTALMSVGQVLLVMALRRAEVSALGPWHFVKITWALGLDLVLFARVPDAWALLGGAVILSANVWLLRRGGPSGG